MSEPIQSTQIPADVAGDLAAGRKRSPARRLGCWLLTAIWFLILLTPCGLFYLAANGEIRLEHGQIPNPYAHPRLLISLISESADRGLRIESSTIMAAESEFSICVETSVTFLLWESSGGNQNVKFCDCYARSDQESAWNLDSTYSAACADAG